MVESNKSNVKRYLPVLAAILKIIVNGFIALAATATNGVAYVYLKNTNCRTLFSPPSQNPQDSMQNPSHIYIRLIVVKTGDPTANGQATNGEIFYYAELPMLMCNTNIKQIKTFSKVNRKFVVNTEWDVDVVCYSLTRVIVLTNINSVHAGY